METKKKHADPEPTPAPQDPMPEPHIAGEIAGGVLIASVIVSTVSLWAIGFLGLVQSL